VIFVASQKALSAEVKAVIKQQLESVSNGWTVYRIARQASRMVCICLLVTRFMKMSDHTPYILGLLVIIKNKKDGSFCYSWVLRMMEERT
jgi:hypothetical protein